MSGRTAPKESPRSDLAILVPAAGRGDRLGRGPKAFLELAGEPILAWLARKARRVGSEVVIAVPPGQLEGLAVLCPGCRGIEGGPTRQATVARLLAASTAPWVLIQDAARPFASADLLRAVAVAAGETGAAGAFLQPEVPVARIQGGFVVEAFQADQVGVFQSPQVFERRLLERVLAEADAGGWLAQSTLQLVQRAGHPVRAIPGEKTNLKLTTEADWKLAASLMEWLA